MRKYITFESVSSVILMIGVCFLVTFCLPNDNKQETSVTYNYVIERPDAPVERTQSDYSPQKEVEETVIDEVPTTPRQEKRLETVKNNTDISLKDTTSIQYIDTLYINKADWTDLYRVENAINTLDSNGENGNVVREIEANRQIFNRKTLLERRILLPHFRRY